MGIEKKEEARLAPSFVFSSNGVDNVGIYLGKTQRDKEVSKRGQPRIQVWTYLRQLLTSKWRHLGGNWI